MKRVCFIYFGIIRNAEVSWPRLQSHVVAPIAAQSDCCVSVAHLYRLKKIEVGRRDEPGGSLFDNLESLEIDELSVMESEHIPQVFHKQQFTIACSVGDAYDNNFQSLRNLFLQLHSLKIATEAAIDTGANIFVFARPDLFYRTALHLTPRLVGRNIVEIPFFQWFGGLNDRFAIAYSPIAARAYGGRIDNLLDYVKNVGQPVQAEQFLMYSLLKHKTRFRPKFSYANRVRTNGALVRENFLPIRSMRFRNMLRRKRDWTGLWP